jgi:hypothetical protein
VPVAWYAPGVLWQAGRELVQSISFQRNLDRREMFTAPLEPIDLSAAADPDGSFWFDFISDTGDGGDATYTVAQAALRRELPLPGGGHLPEGHLLLLGGDLAYPGANALDYQFRFVEMFELAREHGGSRFQHGTAQEKFCAAIPQNHDWFDNISTFSRYFVRNDQGAVAGMRTPQRLSWFAVRLPQRWWVLGLDFALTGDIDRHQFDSFLALLSDPGAEAVPDGVPSDAPRILPGDDVILVYPEPYWLRPLGDGAAPGYPKRYQRLEAQIEARGARIRLRLAGDLHHYQRDSLFDDALPAAPQERFCSHLITCGNGGAFLHPTHSADSLAPKWLSRASEPEAASEELQHRVRIGLASTDPAERLLSGAAQAPTQETSRRTVPIDAQFGSRDQPGSRLAWPDPARSRALAWHNLWALLRAPLSRPLSELGLVAAWREVWNSNLGFAMCLGALYALNAYVNAGVFSNTYRPDGFAPMGELGFGRAAGLWLQAMVFSPFAGFINTGMLVACVRIAWEGPGHWSGKLSGGLLHGMAHGFLIFALFWLASQGVAVYGQGSLVTAYPFASRLAAWLLVGLGGTLCGAALFGAYLALMSGVFGQLPNNAFGSLASPHYKGFLRFKLGGDGLTVHVLGIDEVPRRDAGNLAELPAGWRVVEAFTLRPPQPQGRSASAATSPAAAPSR